jgi:hypothetical protein
MQREAAGTVASLPPVVVQQICLRIGGVVVAIQRRSPCELGLGSELEIFRVAECDADLEISVQWEERLQPWGGRKTFDSGAVWKVFRERDDFIFDFASHAVGRDPYKRMRTNESFTSAQVILNSGLLPEYAWPLEYPADELLITNYLARRGAGVEVHGCGLIDSEAGGLLFLGHSGAGKSTTTMLWKSLRNPEILSDDRIILRLHDGELWMYGTPWHGEAAFASAASAKLNRIFILQHGDRNEMVEMPRSRAVGEMFARCFPPFHSPTGLECTVDFLNRVAAAVSCYEFQFVPDDRAVQAVLDFHD